MASNINAAHPIAGAPSTANVRANFAAAKAEIEVLQGNQLAFGNAFVKASSSSPVFTKTGAGTLNLKAGTTIAVGGAFLHFSSAQAVIMPALSGGTDYAIYACTDGTIRADASFSAPSGYTTADSRQIGGFHYGLVAPGTTVAGGSFATTGNGMIWTQPDVDRLAGINEYSLWDLKFRPRCDPRGMALVAGGFWVDLYFTGTNHIADGTSRAGSDVASGTVLPRIPLIFGGNGTTTYTGLTWWNAAEIAQSHGKALLTHAEFCAAAFGVTEAQSLGGASVTIPATAREPGYTSRYGLEQATGHVWVWCADASTRPDGTAVWAWRNVTGGRGQMYLYSDVGNVRCLSGGTRDSGSSSGSRASYWFVYPWYSYWTIAMRARGDHLVLE